MLTGRPWTRVIGLAAFCEPVAFIFRCPRQRSPSIPSPTKTRTASRAVSSWHQGFAMDFSPSEAGRFLSGGT